MPRVLVVDDDPHTLMVLEPLLASEQYEVKMAKSPLEALSLFQKGETAVVIADQMMPDMTGMELLTLVRKQSPTTVCILMTASTDIRVAEEVVNQRLAHFFVIKPWQGAHLQEIVQQALEMHAERQRNPVAAYGEASRIFAQERARQAAFSLARAVDARDRYTHRHSERVSAFGRILGEAMGLDQKDLEELRIGGLLHDLGKIGVPDEVLRKPGRLSDEEFRHIKMHPVIGVTITEPIDFPWNIDVIVRQHHENYDGSGYPTGVGGDNIALSARIIHLVDAYEAMSSDRVYRKALPPEQIEQELIRCRGTQFDPDVTDVFMAQLHQKRFA